MNNFGIVHELWPIRNCLFLPYDMRAFLPGLSMLRVNAFHRLALEKVQILRCSVKTRTQSEQRNVGDKQRFGGLLIRCL